MHTHIQPLKTAFIGTFLSLGLSLVHSSVVHAYSANTSETNKVTEQQAVEMTTWGVPIVSMDVMRQAYFRDAKAKYNDIVFWSEPSDWKFQFTTPNASTYYIYANFNTKEGPLVLEIPAAVGAGLFGSLENAWQIPLADIGPEGEDQGKGGKYLILPPDYKGDIPDSYFPIHSKTYNGYLLFRAIPESYAKENVEKALALVKKLRLYPLANKSNLADQKFIDMSGKLLDGIMRFDESYYTSLARMINEEPVMPYDEAMMSQLKNIGIEKGKAFKADAMTKKLLTQAAEKVHENVIALTEKQGEPFWSGKTWRSVDTTAAKTGFTFLTNDQLNIDARATCFFLGFAGPAKLGKATYYIMGYFDDAGQTLSGENTYRLHVPANVPAKQFWAFTIYDRETAGFIRKASRVEINSYDQKLQKNEDGSIDLYFGPQAPKGQKTNWIPTAKGKKWFSIFRFYGPESALFEKTWSLPDIEKVK